MEDGLSVDWSISHSSLQCRYIVQHICEGNRENRQLGKLALQVRTACRWKRFISTFFFEWDSTLTFASSLSKSSSTLCESPFAAALTSSSTASPGTCVSNSFFNRADNLSARRKSTLKNFSEHSLSQNPGGKRPVWVMTSESLGWSGRVWKDCRILKNWINNVVMSQLGWRDCLKEGMWITRSVASANMMASWSLDSKI